MHPELRHWLGESLNTVIIQVYVGLIASLLWAVWTNRKPNKRAHKIGLPFFFAGWTSEEELLRHLDHPLNKNQGHERHKQCAGHYVCKVVERGDSGDISPDRVTAMVVTDE